MRKGKVPQSMQSLFRKSANEWLEEARITAYKLLKNKRLITIEEVTAITPLPDYLNRNLLGSVFRTKEFRRIAYTKARRQVARGHAIGLWTLRSEDEEK